METSKEYNRELERARHEYRRLDHIFSFACDQNEKEAAKEGMDTLARIFGLDAVNPHNLKFQIGDEVIGSYNSNAPGGYLHYTVVDIDLRGCSEKYILREIRSVIYSHLEAPEQLTYSYGSGIHKAPKFKYGDIVTIKSKDKLKDHLDVDKMYVISGYKRNGEEYTLLGVCNIVTAQDDDLELVQSFPREYKCKRE